MRNEIEDFPNTDQIEQKIPITQHLLITDNVGNIGKLEPNKASNFYAFLNR